ncbi:MAG: hypothetical protein ACLUUO_20800 [Sellimonas intestinalis]
MRKQMFRRIFLQSAEVQTAASFPLKVFHARTLEQADTDITDRLEHVTIEGMEAAVRVIVELVKIFANE